MRTKQASRLGRDGFKEEIVKQVFFLENLKNAKAKRIINKLANMVATYFNIYDI